MISVKSSGGFTAAAFSSAIAASLCCITPVIALVAGTSSIGANLSWLEPARPYLIGLSLAILAFAWYLKLKPVKTNKINCDCETVKKTSFLQTRAFLGIVTLFTILMMTFPIYAKMFYPKTEVQHAAVSSADNKQQVNFSIQGMTCEGCEALVNNELSKIAGVLAYKTSYNSKSSIVTFDKSKAEIKTIETAINKTGYTVKEYKLINEKK